MLLYSIHVCSDQRNRIRFSSRCIKLSSIVLLNSFHKVVDLQLPCQITEVCLLQVIRKNLLIKRSSGNLVSLKFPGKVDFGSLWLAKLNIVWIKHWVKHPSILMSSKQCWSNFQTDWINFKLTTFKCFVWWWFGANSDTKPFVVWTEIKLN